MIALSVVLLVLLGLGACGQKGPLFLPEPAAAPASVEADEDQDEDEDEAQRRP